MAEDELKKSFVERRSEPRTITEGLYSVEINLGGSIPIYQFKLWDISANGACILVREDSPILKHLRVGQKLSMKYYSTDKSKATEYLKSEIIHITKTDSGRHKGHYLVGVLVVGKPNSS
jgi:hypothetical protein